MQTHSDNLHPARQEFLDRLRERADDMTANRQSEITTGKPDEEALATWKRGRMQVVHMPDDEQGILRISVGGGHNTPVTLDYCTIRGSVGQCIDLLERAVEALKACPS